MKVNFPIIQFIVYAGLLVTAVNIYVNYKLETRNQFAKLMQALNLYLAIHFAFIWLVETFWLKQAYLDQMAPFSLGYGAFLYLSNYLTRNEQITFKQVLPHLVVPTFFWVWFFGLLLMGVNYTDMTLVRTRMPVAIVSLLSYIFYTIFFNKKKILKPYRFVRPIIISGCIALLILVIIAIRVSTMRSIPSSTGTTLVRSVVYICMLCCSIMIFRTQLGLLRRVEH
jgi:hypothetical protein